MTRAPTWVASFRYSPGMLSLAALLCFALRRGSAATRDPLWTGAVVAQLLLPVLRRPWNPAPGDMPSYRVAAVSPPRARPPRARVVDDVLPFACVGARHDRDHRLGVAHVQHLVRNTGLDEDEIPGAVVDGA